MSISPYVSGALIAGAGGLVVWLLTTIREVQLDRARRREQRRTELRGAMANYLAALDTLTLELMGEPPKRPDDIIDRSLDRLATVLGINRVISLIVRGLQRLAYGQRPLELSDRVANASADLRLVAPPAILDLMQELEGLFGRHQFGDARWEAEWKGTRRHIREQFRVVLDDHK